MNPVAPGSNAPLHQHARKIGLDSAIPWPFVEKVSAPDRVDGYVHRAHLLARLDPTKRRVTVLKAPGGFGKTVLLAECFRNLRAAGTVVAWLTLDAEDTPQELEFYLLCAFEKAGLPLGDLIDDSAVPPEVTSSLSLRIRLLSSAFSRNAAPCVLILDELEKDHWRY